jgi:hypothetical protein
MVAMNLVKTLNRDISKYNKPLSLNPLIPTPFNHLSLNPHLLNPLLQCPHCPVPSLHGSYDISENFE